MPDPIALITPAAANANAGPAPAASAAAPADGAVAGDFSSALAALTTPPAAAKPELPAPDPATAPPPALAMATGVRLPLTGKMVPPAPDKSAEQASDKPKTDDAPASADGAAPVDPAMSAPAIALLVLPPADQPPPPVEAGAKARTQPQAAVPQAAMPPREAAAAPARATAQAPGVQPATVGLQLRAAFAGGGETPAHSQATSENGSENGSSATESDISVAASPTSQAAPQLAAFVNPDPAPAAPTAPHALPAGQDLSALVDRLVEARGAAQAGDAASPVSATLNHTEFGRVAVHFAPDADGLNVTLSSPDPAFAGAAQAALAVGATPANDGAQLFDGRGAGGGQTGGRHDAAGNPAGNGSAGNGAGNGSNSAPRGEARFASARPDRPTSLPVAESGAGSIFA